MSRDPNLRTRNQDQVAGHVSRRPDIRVRHLNQVELADRWNVSPRTLERWRWLGEGPRFLKLGGRVLYRVEDIEEFEIQQLRQVSGSAAAAPLATVASRPVGRGSPLVDNARTEQMLMASRGRTRE